MLDGVHRLLQSGANGEPKIRYRVTLEDGIEVDREEVGRGLFGEALDDIMLVGIQGDRTAVPISGTIVHLSGGEAWLVRLSSDLRRNITGAGGLDGRAFALSHDEAWPPFGDALPGVGEGSLYGINVRDGNLAHVTGDGQTIHPRWAR